MALWPTKNKDKVIKLGRLENEILEIQGRKKEMEIELKNSQLDLKNEKRAQEMTLEEERHKHKLVIERKDCELVRQKEDADRSKKILEEDLTKRAELGKLETETLTKLRSEQKIAQAQLEADKKVMALEAKLSDAKKEHGEAMAQQKADLAKEHYDDLAKSLEKFNSEGNASTKFMHEMALSMLDKRSPHDVSVGVDVTNEPRKIEGGTGNVESSKK